MAGTPRYWRECAKTAWRESPAFANDWQWLFGYPLVAVGIYLLSRWIGQESGAVRFLSSNTALGALSVTAIAFFITFAVGFVVRLARVPPILHQQQADKIAELEDKLANKARLELRFDTVTDDIGHHGRSTPCHLVIYNAGSAVAQNTVLHLIAIRPEGAISNGGPARLPLTVKWPDEMARWINPKAEQHLRLFSLAGNYDGKGKFLVLNEPGYDASGQNAWLRLPFERFELDYRVELANGDSVLFTVTGEPKNGERVTVSRKV